jgi:hypothetical protein
MNQRPAAGCGSGSLRADPPRPIRLAGRVGPVCVLTIAWAALSLAATPAASAEPEKAVPLRLEQGGPEQDHPAASAEPERAAPSKAKLAADFNDPLTALPQIFLQDAYTPSNYGTDAQTNRVIARVIVPRVPRFTLFPFVQLVRPSFSLVTVPKGRGSDTRTEFGDVQLFDLLVLPWPGRDSGLLMGFGPVFVFPTATHETAGQGAWQVGPAFGAIYKGIPGFLAGCLLQNPISFAYTSPDRPPLSTLLVQPILLKHLWRGLYVKSADATWAFGWRDGSPTTLPLSLGLGYVIPREGSPPLNFFVSGEWMVHRDNAPIAPRTTVRFGFTIAFPQLRLW